jgi:hypothetical protein
MVRDDGAVDLECYNAALDRRYQLLCGTESIYLFVRLYTLLCSVLSETRNYCDTLPPQEDPSKSYFVPNRELHSKGEKDATKQPTYYDVLVALNKVLAKEMSIEEYEARGRRAAKERVSQIAALPRLVERCASTLIKVAQEDALLHLYDFCQYTEVDPVSVRSHCLAVVPDAFYRIQYDYAGGSIKFCYIAENEALLTSPRREEEEDEIEEDDNTNMDTRADDLMEEDPIEDFSDGNGGEPASKRFRM